MQRLENKSWTTVKCGPPHGSHVYTLTIPATGPVPVIDSIQTFEWEKTTKLCNIMEALLIWCESWLTGICHGWGWNSGTYRPMSYWWQGTKLTSYSTTREHLLSDKSQVHYLPDKRTQGNIYWVGRAKCITYLTAEPKSHTYLRAIKRRPVGEEPQSQDT